MPPISYPPSTLPQRYRAPFRVEVASYRDSIVREYIVFAHSSTHALQLALVFGWPQYAQLYWPK